MILATFVSYQSHTPLRPVRSATRSVIGRQPGRRIPSLSQLKTSPTELAITSQTGALLVHTARPATPGTPLSSLRLPTPIAYLCITPRASGLAEGALRSDYETSASGIRHPCPRSSCTRKSLVHRARCPVPSWGPHVCLLTRMNMDEATPGSVLSELPDRSRDMLSCGRRRGEADSHWGRASEYEEI
ncbi:hypothetical protein K466DRAFT_277743 [Polyporus arcularius HHB13444]|uniref:Uncharacterized protein n=1 Tax=Polyporus arcularius HHB13444 TaxID=1314778 RepID=A0A5C3P2C8_9APHY|nr:hypothetical protein K466DRAFT_277743 [Polyporus arcularius HHB13444]